MKGFFERHIYGILGTIIVHLIIAIIFMLIKLSTTNQLRTEAVLISFESIEEKNEPDLLEIPESFAEMLDNEEYWANIAANIASTADEDFNIDEYINQIKEELIASGEISEDDFLEQEISNQTGFKLLSIQATQKPVEFLDRIKIVEDFNENMGWYEHSWIIHVYSEDVNKIEYPFSLINKVIFI